MRSKDSGSSRPKAGRLAAAGYFSSFRLRSFQYRTAVAQAQTCDGDDAARVDLYSPVFTDPTTIDNPLFPVSGQGQVLHLGKLEGDPLRFETTLLPRTKSIRFNGQAVKVAVIQYVAYQDLKIIEVAYDFFAQDDLGAVWYFGEDVDNYADGVIEDHEGAWLAGRDGPPGMIMPAAPKVGDIYRPENIAGSVFEEVTVKQIGVIFQVPTGPIPGGIAVEECLLDGTTEEKFFAPGYGEFQVQTEDETAKVALLVPKDSLAGGVPASLDAIEDAADALMRGSGATGEKTDVITAQWARYRKATLPPLLKSQMNSAVKHLTSAVGSGTRDEIRRAAVLVAHAAVDLTLQHESPVDGDRDRLDIWRQQLELDRKSGQAADVKDEVKGHAGRCAARSSGRRKPR